MIWEEGASLNKDRDQPLFDEELEPNAARERVRNVKYKGFKAQENETACRSVFERFQSLFK